MKTTTPTKRAALYVRLSEDTDSTTSPKRQREATAAYATSRGWDVVGTHEDIDVSATHSRLDRPGLNALRASIARGDVDVVIVYKMDRLARNVLDTLILLDEWRKVGCEFASTAEGLDMTTSNGRAMATLIAVFAQMEADAISFRVTASIAELRRTGRFAGGTVPFGYTTAPAPSGPGRVLVVEESEAVIVREVAATLLSGVAPYRVCADLNTRGVPSPRSAYRRVVREGGNVTTADRGTWRVQSLRKTLTSDHLAGRQTHGGEVMRGEDGLMLAVWSPILEGSTLVRLRAILLPSPDTTATPKPRRVRHARLLSGLVFCSVCGAKMYVRSSSGRPIYGCPTQSGGSVCPSPRISAEALEEHVVADVLALVGSRPMLETVSESATPSEAVSNLADVSARITTVTTAMGAVGADLPALLIRLSTLTQARASLQAEVDAAPVLSYLRPTGLTFAETYTATDSIEARRLLLAAEVAEVLISPTESRSSVMDTHRVNIVPVRDDPSAA